MAEVSTAGTGTFLLKMKSFYQHCTLLLKKALTKYKSILKYKEMVNVPLIASGGVSSIEDIKKLYSFKIHGVIVGKAIYDNKVKINEIFNIK